MSITAFPNTTSTATATAGHRAYCAPRPADPRTESASILCVDDDNDVLQSMTRRLKRKHAVHVANSGAQAFATIQEAGPFALVISDYRMPGMNGVELLSRIREVAPETVRVMLTGATDLDAAMDAINNGEVFRFLAKPTPGELLDKTVAAGIEQHRLITSQRILLSETLHGSIKMLTDLLALTSPGTFGHATRVKSLASDLAAQMQEGARWELEIAAMMSFVGYLTLPPEIVQRSLSMEPLNEDESELHAGYPATSRDVIANIPRMEGVARIIEFHNKNFDGSGLPAGTVRGEAIPLGSRILKVASDFQMILSRVQDSESALHRLRRSSHYDPTVVAALQAICGTKTLTTTDIPIRELRSGLVIAEDLYSANGKILLLARGQELTDFLVQRLRNFFRQQSADATVAVLSEERPRPNQDA